MKWHGYTSFLCCSRIGGAIRVTRIGKWAFVPSFIPIFLSLFPRRSKFFIFFHFCLVKWPLFRFPIEHKVDEDEEERENYSVDIESIVILHYKRRKRTFGRKKSMAMFHHIKANSKVFCGRRKFLIVSLQRFSGSSGGIILCVECRL